MIIEYALIILFASFIGSLIGNWLANRTMERLLKENAMRRRETTDEVD